MYLKKNVIKNIGPIEKLVNNLKKLYLQGQTIFNKHKEGVKINHREYLYFVFTIDIYYRIRDILILNKHLRKNKDSFDSSLFVLARSVLESYFYLKYLLCEKEKIEFRLNAFICHSIRNNEIKIFNCLKALNTKKKFIFDPDKDSIMSLQSINDLLSKYNLDMQKCENRYKKDIQGFQNEVNLFKDIEGLTKRCDEINNITTVENGKENISLEWMYNYVYRFQCMSVHQSLRDKEKVFDLFNTKSKPNNIAIIGLLNDLSERLIDLHIE